ncbi:MAG: hypothetical protein PF517_13245 [Salinivirgaceae bacterium]|jgi:hypothetical protein|nr:hypothetical protein [Salinivirgaceae bacterium]
MKKTVRLNVDKYSNENGGNSNMEALYEIKSSFLRISSSSLIFVMLAFVAALLFSSCEQDDVEPAKNELNILPSKFKVDIPSSISSNSSLKSASLKSADGDTLKGNEIYENLKYFIAIGEGAADIAEEIIWAITAYDIQSVIEITFTGDDDNRVKHLVVQSDVTFQDRNWEYQLTLTDLELEGEADGGIGMQVFWNNSPTEGIALLKPVNMNINDADENGNAMYSVEYSEKGMGDYEAYMIVQIADLDNTNGNDDRYAVDAIKMFVGKNGDNIDIYGNSNHPNAKFFTDETGFNWAFVASGKENQNIAIAEVALPPSTLDATDRDVILKDYSIKNVFTDQINIWFSENYGIRPDSADLAGYLINAYAPGYFDTDGFIQGGTAPDSSYNGMVDRINKLIPYNPKDIAALEIGFKE